MITKNATQYNFDGQGLGGRGGGGREKSGGEGRGGREGEGNVMLMSASDVNINK